MNTIDKIRAEIRRLYSEDSDRHIVRTSLEALSNLMDFLDTLEEPEQPTMGYDEAYLNEKIAKASKSWEGVDVDKFMDEVRGREPVSEDLEEAAETHVKNKYCLTKLLGAEIQEAVNDFIAGAEWQKKQTLMPEDTVIFNKGVEEGKRLMMEGAVEGTVIELGETYKDLSLSVIAKELNQVLQPLGVGDGNKVKIIIVKEEEE